MGIKTKPSYIEDVLKEIEVKEEIFITDFQVLSEWIDRGVEICVLDIKGGYKYPKYTEDETIIDIQEQIKSREITTYDQLLERDTIIQNYELYPVKDKNGNEYAIIISKNNVVIEIIADNTEGISVAINDNEAVPLTDTNQFVLGIGSEHNIHIYKDGTAVKSHKIDCTKYVEAQIKLNLFEEGKRLESLNNTSSSVVQVESDTNLGSSSAIIGIGIVAIILIAVILLVRNKQKSKSVDQQKQENKKVPSMEELGDDTDMDQTIKPTVSEKIEFVRAGMDKQASELGESQQSMLDEHEDN